MRRDDLLQLLRSKSTIFTIKDVALLWGTTNAQLVRKKLHRYVNAGKLVSVRRGIYAKDKDFENYELATKIFTPAYISLETVLAKAGIVFQFYSQIFVASYLTREVTIAHQTYTFKKIKDSILTNQIGIEVKQNYFIATPERAFLDILYLNKAYHFDNLSPIRWDIVNKILPIYGGNHRMANAIKQCRKAMRKEIS